MTGLFTTKKDRKKIDLVYNQYKDKTNNYSREQLKKELKDNGYSKKVINNVFNKFNKNKVNFKENLNKKNILKDLSKTVKSVNNKDSESRKKNKEEKDQKTTKPQKDSKLKKPKVNFFKKIGNFFKKIYFFFEDRYYKMIDWISKTIPISNLTDRIDKYFPSFILFLVILGLIIFFVINSITAYSTTSLKVNVTDSTDAPLADALVTLNIDGSITKQKTDAFGDVLFLDLKAKDTDLNITKEYYNPKKDVISLKSKKDLIQKNYSLDINTDKKLSFGGKEQVRDLVFVDNYDRVILEKLNIELYCSNQNLKPDPNVRSVNSGKTTITQPAGCGDLKISVTSDNFLEITNQIVPSNNKVILKKRDEDKGELTFNVKDLDNNPITDATINIYKQDNQQTSVDESNLKVNSKTTDVYGRSVFKLKQASYLANVNKQGFLGSEKNEVYDVYKNQNLTVDLLMLTKKDIQNIDCSIEKYKVLCKDGEIDYNNPILSPYVFCDDSGCTLGSPKTVNVSLKDSNSQESVIGDISLYKKVIDSNSYSIVSTKDDVNSTSFNIVDLFDYQLRVSDTEKYGYIIPEPFSFSGKDLNKTILLDYSSELNSGKIGVNVKSQGFNIANSSVYLFYADQDLNQELVSPTPKYTDVNGDVNFDLVRSGKSYFAYAISNNKDGRSDSVMLDANTYEELDIEIDNTPTTLILETNVSDYDINFYTPTKSLITDYVVNDLQNNKKEYIFSTDVYTMYGILDSDNYSEYITDQINLTPGQVTEKEINLIQLNNCPDNEIEYLGMYNEYGDLEIDSIDLINHNLLDTYKLKFRYSSCDSENKQDIAHIRAGTYKLLNDDFIFLKSFNSFKGDILRFGNSYSGDLTDWNLDYFTNNYSYDYNFSNSENRFKWLDIDFSDTSVIDFSVNINFLDTITSINKYKLFYRARNNTTQTYFSFDPSISNYNDWGIVPEGFFYAPTKTIDIPFTNEDYIYEYDMLDVNNNKLSKTGDSYYIDIYSDYNYDLNFLYLNNSSLIDQNFIQKSENTNNNLKYSDFSYIDNNGYNLSQSSIDSNKYSLNISNIDFSYMFENESKFSSDGFFKTNASLVSDIFSEKYLEVKTNSYVSDNEFIVFIETDLDDKIYIGDNDVNISVFSSNGNPIEDVSVSYELDNITYTFGNPSKTNSSGYVNNSIYILKNQVNKDIIFKLSFPASYGLSNNNIEKTKKINLGVLFVGQELKNKLTYIDFNNQQHTDMFYFTNKKYEIENKRSDTFSLDDIEFIDENNSNIYNILETKNLMESSNQIPLTIFDTNKIFTYLDINSSEFINNKALFLDKSKTNDYIYTIYRNYLELSNNIQIIKDVNSNVQNRYLSFDKNILDRNGILYENNKFEVEFIDTVNESINLDYNLINLNNKDIVVNEIKLIGDNNCSIDIDSINNNLLTYNGKTISEFTQTTKQNPTKKTIYNYLNLDFDLYLKNNYNISSGDLKLVFDLKYLGDVKNTYDFKIIEPISYKIYQNITDMYYFGSYKDEISLLCYNNNCENDVSYTLENLTKTYDILFNDSKISNNTKNINLVSPQNIKVPINNTLNLDLDVNTSYNGSLPNYNYDNIDIDNNISVLDTKIIEKDYDINVSLVSDNSNILSTYNLNENYCLSYGSEIDGSDFFMIGDCEFTQKTDCKSGKDAVPNLLYDWSANDSNKNWLDFCTQTTSDYNSQKGYCDSLQGMFTAYYRLKDSNYDSYYIYLTKDLIDNKKEFLKDSIDVVTNSSLGFTSMLDNYDDIIKNSKIDSGDYSLERDEAIVGLYKLEFLDASGNTFDSSSNSLKIKLSLEKPIPNSQDSLFYHIPFDGLKSIESDDYGIKSIYSQDEDNEFRLNSSKEISENTKNDYSTTIILDNFTKLNSSDLQKILKSNGDILNISKDYDSSLKPVFNFNYYETTPIPIYALFKDIKDNNGYYRLYEENSIFSIDNEFLSWDGYSDSDIFKYKDSTINYDFNPSSEYYKEIKDTPVYDSSSYQSHMVDLNSIYNIDNVLLKTFLYFPRDLGSNQLNDYNLSLDYSNLDNSNNSKFYDISDLSNITKTEQITLDSQVNDTYDNLTEIFLLIENNKACVIENFNSVKIKWNPEYIDINKDYRKEIVKNSNVLDNLGSTTTNLNNSGNLTTSSSSTTTTTTISSPPSSTTTNVVNESDLTNTSQTFGSGT